MYDGSGVPAKHMVEIRVDRLGFAVAHVDVADVLLQAAVDDASVNNTPQRAANSRRGRIAQSSMSPARPRTPRISGPMSRSMLERKLIEVGERLKQLRAELVVTDEQFSHFAEAADDARLRALVSETPLADREHHEAQRHFDAMGKHRAEVQSSIDQLERRQDELLDRLMAEH